MKITINGRSANVITENCKCNEGSESSQEVLDIVDENRSLMNTIRQRQKNWLGHVLTLCLPCVALP